VKGSKGREWEEKGEKKRALIKEKRVRLRGGTPKDLSLVVETEELPSRGENSSMRKKGGRVRKKNRLGKTKNYLGERKF